VTRNRVLVLVLVVIVFLVAGGYLIYRSTGGGGATVTLDLSVTGDKLTPASPTVKQGDRVTMTITADKKEEIHLHGYDIPFEVPSPGGKVTHTFTADKSGSFEMEIEDTSTHLAYFTVQP
jgi:FtsP/CotA-like multicopper oxidase with cupredoxin domain